MTFACFFRGLCAFLCAFGKIAQFENTHFAMKSCKKALKTYVFKAFSWSEWRDSNSRPHGPEPSRDVPQQRHKGNLKLSSKYAESLDTSMFFVLSLYHSPAAGAMII